MPYIKHFAVYNHHKLPDFDVDVSLPDQPFAHVILTGANGAGKSTLLRGMAEEVERYQKYSDYASRIEPFKVAVRSGERDNLGKGFLLDRRAGFGDIRHEKVPYPSFFVGLDWSADPTDNDFEPEHFIAAYLSDIRQLNIAPAVGPRALDDAPVPASESVASRFEQYLLNQKFKERLAEPEDLSEAQAIRDWFAQFEASLAELFGIAGLKLELLRQKLAFRFLEPGGATYDFRQLAAGHASVLAILSELILRLDATGMARPDSRKTGVALIDELDLHLHPALQERILPFLVNNFPRVQFIVATHSPAVICSVDNAVVVDLSDSIDAVPSIELRGMPYGRLMTAHFGIDSDVDLQSTRKLRRLRVLLERETLTADEEAELSALQKELRNTSNSLATAAWNQMVARRIDREFAASSRESAAAEQAETVQADSDSD